MWFKLGFLAGGAKRLQLGRTDSAPTPNLYANIVDFGGFDSSTILIWRGGISRPIGDFPESLRQAMLVGIMLVGKLGVWASYVGLAAWKQTPIVRPVNLSSEALFDKTTPKLTHLPKLLTMAWVAVLGTYWVHIGRGDDTVGNPHRARISRFELLRAYPLIEIRQAVPCRAIRGISISVNSTPL